MEMASSLFFRMVVQKTSEKETDSIQIGAWYPFVRRGEDILQRLHGSTAVSRTGGCTCVEKRQLEASTQVVLILLQGGFKGLLGLTGLLIFEITEAHFEGKVSLLRRQFLTSLETLSCGGPFVQPVIDNTQIVVCTDVVAVGPDGCLVCGGCLVQVIGFEGTVTFGPEPTSLGVPRFRKCLCYFNPIGSYGFRSMVTVFWNFQPVFPTELPAWFNLSASPLLRENR